MSDVVFWLLAGTVGVPLGGFFMWLILRQPQKDSSIRRIKPTE